MDNHQYTAFFDLDLTLTSGISGNALVSTAWKKGQLRLRDLLKGFWLYLLYMLRLRDPLAIIGEMTAWVRGKSEREMELLCTDVVNGILIPRLFSDALSEIDFHRKKSARIILLSSALDSVCREISEKIGADGYLCSSLEVSDGIFTGRPAGRLCYGEEKLNRLNGYCTEFNTDKSLSWYYSDSISDLPVLSAVGNPVCVNPDSRLRKEALRRGWKILSWKN